MANSRDREIDRLQRAVFSATGRPSDVDIDRLQKLLDQARTEKALALGESAQDRDEAESTDPQLRPAAAADSTGDPVAGTGREPARHLDGRPALRLILLSTIGALIVGTLGGFCVGYLMGGTATATPHTGPANPAASDLPANVEAYDEDSVRFYGEIEGVRVWSATRHDDHSLCLMGQAVAPEDIDATDCTTAGHAPRITFSGLDPTTARTFTLNVPTSGPLELRYATVDKGTLR